MPTLLSEIPLSAVRLEHISELLAHGEIELKQLEYKRTIPPTTAEYDQFKKTNKDWRTVDDPFVEFAADVSAMANSDGGDIVFGVDGKTFTFTPITVIDKDKTKTRLQQLIVDHIEPRIIGFDFSFIPYEPETAEQTEPEPNQYVIVLRIMPSIVGPHRILKGKKDFYLRYPGGKHQMDITQIRSAFLSSASAVQRAREWRQHRFSEILQRRGQTDLETGPWRIMHFIPLRFSDPAHIFSHQALSAQKKLLLPITRGAADVRFNADGVLSYRRIGKPECRGYVQLYSNGQIEAVQVIQVDSEKKVFASQPFEEDLLRAIAMYLEALNGLGVSLPLLVGLSYVHVKGYQVAGKRYAEVAGEVERYAITKDAIPYRDVLIVETIPAERVPEVCRPLVDLIWNAAGYSGSDQYDKDGKHRHAADLEEFVALTKK